jgi:transposase
MGVLTDRAEVSRLDVVDTGRRRRWTEEEKLRIVSESLSGPRLVSVTARRYGIVRSLLVSWRRQFGVRAAGGSAGLVPAVIVPEVSAKAAPSSSRMEIVAGNGRRIIVDAGVDAAALSRVLDVLERR